MLFGGIRMLGGVAMSDERLDKIIEETSAYIKEKGIKNKELSSFLNNLRLDVLNVLFKNDKGLKVLKRRGGVEEFDIEKLKRNIASASDDVKQSLNEGDLNDIGREVLKRINENNQKVIFSKEIISVTERVLYDLGYDGVLVGYKNFTK